jgi:hypothetical protein
MPRSIDHEVLKHPNTLRFAQLACDFCSLIEKVESLPKEFFLQQVEEQLSLVYSAAHKLTDPYIWHDDDESDVDKFEVGFRDRIERWTEWRERIGQKLEPYRWFTFVYDPVSLSDKAAIEGDLGDVLTDVYLGLLPSAIWFKQEDPVAKASAVWNWWFGFHSDWGAHAAEAILPIHRILHTHCFEGEFDR